VLKLEVSYRGLLLAALAIVSLWALIQLWSVIVLVITAFIFMAALLPYVEWLVRHSFPRVVAVLVVLLCVLIVIGGAAALVIPAMVGEFRDIKTNLPENAKDLEVLLAHFNIHVELQERARNVEWGDLISGRTALDYGQRVLLGLVSILTVVMLTIYLLMDAPRLSRFLYQFVPPGHEPKLEHWLTELSRVVGGYVRAQFITSACIGIYTAIVMFAIGAPNPLAFGVLAAFADILPLIGGTLAIAPAVAATFQHSSQTALILLGLLFLYQQFEDRFLTPRIYGSTLNLPPLIVLITVLSAGKLIGVAGVLLGLPAAAVGRVVLDYYLDQRSNAITPSGSGEDVLAPDSQEC
jgi:predicted PurR-regulated permease PerM